MRSIFSFAILACALAAQPPKLDLYVSSRDTHSIKRFDGATGEYLGDFVKPRAGGLANPRDLAFGPRGNLWVRDTSSAKILVFHRDTSAPLRRLGEKPVFASDPTVLEGVTSGPDGALYVCDWEEHVIRRFDADTGQPLGVFAQGSGMRYPNGLVFGPRPGVSKDVTKGSDDVRERTGLRFSVLESKIRRRLIRTKTPYGFKIRSVDEGSPGAAAGLEKGHILMKWNGEPLRTVEQLRKALRATPKGTEVEVEYSVHVKKASLFNRRPWRTREGTIVLR